MLKSFTFLHSELHHILNLKWKVISDIMHYLSVQTYAIQKMPQELILHLSFFRKSLHCFIKRFCLLIQLLSMFPHRINMGSAALASEWNALNQLPIMPK